MKNLLILLTFFCFNGSLFSQKTTIICNIEKGTIQTFSGGKEISEPILKKGQAIEVQIKDYNNYLYDVEITETVEKSAPADGGFLKGFDALNLTNLLQSDVVLPNSIENLSTASGRTIDVESSESAEVQTLMNKAKNLVSNLKYIESNLLEKEKKIEALYLDREIQNSALGDFNKIKLNPSLPVSSLKKLGNSIFERALHLNKNEDLSYDKVLQKFEDRKAFTNIKEDLKTTKITYTQQIEELVNTEVGLQSVASRATLANFIFSDIHGFLGRSKLINEKFEDLNTRLVDIEAKAKEDKIENLVSIWLEREALISNNFSKQHTTFASGDAMTFDIILKLKDSVSIRGAQREIRLAPLKIPVYGAFKINTSLGVGFGQYFKPTENYFLRDETIQKEKGDAFLPMITSFVHFYKQNKGNASFGGSIGLGLPVSGGTANLQAINFFFGPSLMFGSSERLVLSCGLMGGRPSRLASEYQVGDTFLQSVDLLPVRKVYELGYFLGLSYNLKG